MSNEQSSLLKNNKSDAISKSCVYKLNNSKEDFFKEEGNGQYGNIICDVLRLKLHKPKNWNWELYTSKGFSHIKLPRILLFDDEDNLLVDAKGQKDEHIYNSKITNSNKRVKSQKYGNSFNVNSTPDSTQIIFTKFDNLSLNSSQNLSRNSHRSSYGSGRQSLHSSRNLTKLIITTTEKKDTFSQIPVILSTPPSATTSFESQDEHRALCSSSSSHSSLCSNPILERLGPQRGCSLSSGSSEERNTYDKPRYFIRSSRAGTILVKEDSFEKHPNRRRRNCLRKTPSRTESFRFPSLRFYNNNKNKN